MSWVDALRCRSLESVSTALGMTWAALLALCGRGMEPAERAAFVAWLEAAA